MRVLVYQHFHPGHHYNFVGHLLPALRGVADEVVVAITEEGRASAEFTEFLSPQEDWVRFETSLPPWRDRIARNRRIQMHVDLRNEVRRTRPDYVLVPSGDQHTIAMGMFRLVGLGGLPGHRYGEIGIHWGRGRAAAGPRERLKDVLDLWKLATAGWNRVHIINLLFYEAILGRGGSLARRATLMPCPVLPVLTERATSRRRLGLPDEGRLIGIVGAIDYRKAVPEFLRAFRSGAPRPTDRALIAGAIHPQYRRLIDSEFGDLVRTQRLLLIDRFLSRTEYHEALAALDIVCVPYPRSAALSAVLLEGLAAARPVLASREGWCGEIVQRFRAGWSCDVLSPTAFADTVRTAFDSCEAYRPTAATKRLVEFNSPANFGASWVTEISRLRGLGPPGYRPWSYVTEVVD